MSAVDQTWWTGAATVLAGGGEMGALMRAHDWSTTPLGPVERWSRALKTGVRLLLTSRQPMWLGWGKELTFLYNDPYRAIVGGKHPWALGRPTAEVWREIWPDIGPRIESTLGGDEGTYDEALLLIMDRHGYAEETYYTFSYSPIPDDTGRVAGIFCANTDETRRVFGERQMALLRELAAGTAQARTVQDACSLSMRCLETNQRDMPFALLYLLDQDQERAALAGSAHITACHPAAPAALDLDDAAIWPMAEAIGAAVSCFLVDLDTSFGALPSGAWDRPPARAAIMPLTLAGQPGHMGMLIVGLNPYRVFDDDYRGFIELVAGQISTAIGNARAYEEERKRAEALAELDRAKTTFFNNISHEFRTPLTLMLGPLEEVLAAPTNPSLVSVQAEMAHRNTQRLLRLANTLLDFSRIQAGRIDASYEPTDLSALTADLASAFRSAVERAGLRLVVDCPPLPAPVYVDHEMWEKIVLNLLSNAFKFTLAGEIAVTLRAEGESVRLAVRDTGAGIPEAERSRVFERFHRVRDARGRTQEGTGIGLALVRELVTLHGGAIDLESELGTGTTVTVTIPLGTAHLPADRIGAARTLPSTATGAAPYIEEALRWLPDRLADAPQAAGEQAARRARPTSAASGDAREGSGHHPSSRDKGLARILLADDNADMRAYLGRLLGERYAVEAVADGAAALAAARERPPDLVLSDVMMPGLDGLSLVRALRADPQTSTIPIILLSARAGAEARVEGLGVGADDYLVKPFVARELQARVEAHLRLAALRKEARDTLAAERDRLWNEVEARTRAEAALHAAEARQSFLLRLSDALRPLADPEAIQAEAARLLGDYLRADHTYYASIDEAGCIIVRRDYVRGGVMSAAGRYRSEDWPFMDRLRAGETVVVDRATSPLLSGPERAALVALAVDAFAVVPLIKDGILTAMLAVSHATPREWAPEEVALLQGVAERTWSSVARAHAEELLRRQGDLLALAHDAVILRDPRGEIVVWNNGAAALYGWTAAEAVGAISHDLLQTRVLASGESGAAIDATLAVHGAWGGDLEHSRRDGTRIVVESRQALLRGVDGEPETILEVNRDATSREQVARLHRLTTALAAAATSDEVADVIMSEGFAALGAGSGCLALLTEDGAAFTTVRAVGYPENVVAAWPSFAADAAVPIADAVRAREPLILATRAERAARYPHLADAQAMEDDGALLAIPLLLGERAIGGLGMICAEERHFSMEIRAVMSALGEICAQAIERARLHEAEQTVRAAAEAERDRLQQVLDVLPVGVVIADARGMVEVLNQAGRDIVGMDTRGNPLPVDGEEEQDGYRVRRPDNTPYPPADLPLSRTLRTGEVVHDDLEIHLHAQTRRETHLLVNSAPLRDASGTVVGAVSAFQDITALREMDRAREEFLFSAAHDLKNPLTSIRGYAQLAQRRLARLEAPEAAQALGQLVRMQESVDAMLGLINELVDVARQQMGGALDLHREQTDLIALVQGAVEACDDAHRRAILLDVEAPALPADIDAARITRVVGNLLSNAIKYSPAESAVTVRLSREEGAAGPEAVLVVRDEGMGIPAADLPYIFKRFYRARNVVDRVAGTGIGLAGARAIVEQHGGTITVESAEGAGTTFTVHLPLRTP